jgi:phage anti-repressor protein
LLYNFKDKNMNELIKVTEKEGKQLVSARELHRFLEVGTELSKWVPRMLEYGFDEGIDFTPILTESTGGRPSNDWVLTIDCAKEISMLQRTERGKEARKYFIECEKIAKDIQELNAPKLPINLKEAYLALAQAEEEKELLLLQNENLNTVLDNLLEWVSIIKVSQHNKISEKEFNWRKLKAKSNELGYQTKRAESPRFGYMILYHVDAFRACYPQFDYNING